MNALKTPILEFPLCSASAGGQLVGVALLYPVPDACTPLAARIFHGAVVGGLSRLGIVTSDAGTLFGPGFVVWAAEVQHPNEALQAIRKITADMPLLPMCQIAFWDIDHGQWRTIEPADAPPFGRFFQPEVFQAAMEWLARDEDWLRKVAALARAKYGGT